jgi:hypothetical protein
MHFPTTTLFPLLALLTLTTAEGTLDPTLAHIGFNGDLHLDTISPVRTYQGKPLEVIEAENKWDYTKTCEQDAYACGSFSDRGVDALRAIYQCDKNVFKLREVCHEGGRIGARRIISGRRIRGRSCIRLWVGIRRFVFMISNCERWGRVGWK